GLLLMEAVMLLVLLLIHTSASAQDSGNFGALGNSWGVGETTSGSGGPAKSHPGASGHPSGPHGGGESAYLCGSRDASCVTGGDAADIYAGGGGRGQDFSGSGNGGGGCSGGGN